MMSESGTSLRGAEVRRVLVRWSALLAALVLVTVWSTWRLTQAAALSSRGVDLAGAHDHAEPAIDYWTCSMHPEVHADEAGSCPQCGMSLLPKYAGSEEIGVAPAMPHAGHAEAAPKRWYKCTMPECGDQGSDDPNSRCPGCGMKREEVALDMGSPGEAKLTLNDRARRLAALATEPVASRLLSKKIRTVGRVTYDETRRRMVSAWTGGRIDRLFADFTGMVVEDGDHLVEIYSPELVSAQEEFLQAIVARDAMSTEASGAARLRSDALVESARRKLSLLGITDTQIDQIARQRKATSHLVLHAPLGGTIVRKWVMEGQYVKTGDPLYQIADLTHVWLMVDLYEADLPWIVPNQSVVVTAQALPGEAFDGRVVFVDPIVDERTRTVKVRVNVANPDRRLKPEMYVKAELDVPLGAGGRPAVPPPDGAFACPMHTWETSDAPALCPVCEMDMVPAGSLPGYLPPAPPAPVLSVRYEAVMQTGQQSLVYVEVEPGTYEGVEVLVGPVARGADGRRYYPVLNGLSAGDQVVTRGNFVIDSQMQIAGKPSLLGRVGDVSEALHDHGKRADEPAPSHGH